MFHCCLGSRLSVECHETLDAIAQQRIAEAKGDAQSQLIRAGAAAEASDLRATSLMPELLQAHTLEKWDGNTCPT